MMLAQILNAARSLVGTGEPVAEEVPAEHHARVAWLAARKTRLNAEISESRRALEVAKAELDSRSEREHAGLEALAAQKLAELDATLATDLHTALDLAVANWRSAPDRKHVLAVFTVVSSFAPRFKSLTGLELSPWPLVTAMAHALLADDAQHLEASLLDATTHHGTVLTVAGHVMSLAFAKEQVPRIEALLLQLEREMLGQAQSRGAASAEVRERWSILRSHLAPGLRGEALNAFDAKCGAEHAARLAAEYRPPPARDGRVTHVAQDHEIAPPEYDENFGGVQPQHAPPERARGGHTIRRSALPSNNGGNSAA